MEEVTSKLGREKARRVLCRGEELRHFRLRELPKDRHERVKWHSVFGSGLWSRDTNPRVLREGKNLQPQEGLKSPREEDQRLDPEGGQQSWGGLQRCYLQIARCNSFILSSFYVPGSALHARSAVENKAGKNPVLWRYILVRRHK